MMIPCVAQTTGHSLMLPEIAAALATGLSNHGSQESANCSAIMELEGAAPEKLRECSNTRLHQNTTTVKQDDVIDITPPAKLVGEDGAQTPGIQPAALKPSAPTKRCISDSLLNDEALEFNLPIEDLEDDLDVDFADQPDFLSEYKVKDPMAAALQNLADFMAKAKNVKTTSAPSDNVLHLQDRIDAL